MYVYICVCARAHVCVCVCVCIYFSNQDMKKYFLFTNVNFICKVIFLILGPYSAIYKGIFT
jgi:hypothetical protein